MNGSIWYDSVGSEGLFLIQDDSEVTLLPMTWNGDFQKMKHKQESGNEESQTPWNRVPWNDSGPVCKVKKFT